MSPGMSPGTQHYIVNYNPYTPLNQWETMKAPLKQEVMPSFRHCVGDYLPVTKHPQGDVFTPPPSLASARVTGNLPGGLGAPLLAGGSLSARPRDVQKAAF